MCTYIAITLPANADWERMWALADERGLGWKEFSNQHLQSQVDPGSKWYLTTRKHCDCGTLLGSAARASRARFRGPQSEVPTLRKRGWSDTKIGRWLNEKTATQVRRQQQLQASVAASPEIDSWIEFLRSAVGSAAAKRVGVLLHEYSGSIEGERIAIARRESVPLAAVTSERLCTMEPDVLYQFG